MIASGRTLVGMPNRRFRMGSIERAEALLRLLDLDDAFRPSRPNGYAYARIVAFRDNNQLTLVLDTKEPGSARRGIDARRVAGRAPGVPRLGRAR
jgi:hypothetical protein